MSQLPATIAIVKRINAKRQAKQTPAVKAWLRLKSEVREFARDTVTKQG